MRHPKDIEAKSIMPGYPWMLTDQLDFEGIQRKVDAMVMLGVPYGEAVNDAPGMARAQAEAIGQSIASQGGPADLSDKEIVAMVAYLQRLGRDISAPSAAGAAGAP
jgi:cytochrome c oxidase cbb3-type subunit I/II